MIPHQIGGDAKEVVPPVVAVLGLRGRPQKAKVGLLQQVVRQGGVPVVPEMTYWMAGARPVARPTPAEEEPPPPSEVSTGSTTQAAARAARTASKALPPASRMSTAVCVTSALPEAAIPKCLPKD